MSKPNPYAELLKALQATSKPDSDGMTTNEIAVALECNYDRALERLRHAVRAGKVIYSGDKTVKRIDGKSCKSPAYKLAKGAK